jgi:3-hydroxyacyl-CoA dehydrogenase
MSQTISTTSNIAVIRLDHPPVNALGHALRQHIAVELERAENDASVHAVLLIGSGNMFSAGADIAEFGKSSVALMSPEICERIESCSKPVVAAIHGFALGGGCELALAAHYRIAQAGAKFGLPEVQLGLLPGAGGTQRLPRLTGAKVALDLILSGRQVSAEQAREMGMIDRIATDPDIENSAFAYIRELLAAAEVPRRTSSLMADQGDRAAAQAALVEARRDVAAKARGLLSPHLIIDAVQAAVEQPFERGLAIERELLLRCLQSPQCEGLVHAFFAEREVVKAPETHNTQSREIRSVGVVGGGTMGAGIAVALLDAGLPVVLIERDAENLARGRANVEKVYDGLLAKGRIDAAQKQAVLARYSGATDYAALKQVDLVIEAVFEDMTVKKAVLAQLDRVCKPGTVLATNTSYLDIDELAASIARPADVLGLHFFSPANIMKLLEIVVPKQVSADVVATGFALAKRLKKVAVRAGVCDGFIGNRMLAVYRQAADAMMEDGASPYQIDEAVREFGYPMGPYQVTDLAGGDIGWATRKRRAATRDPRARYVQIPDRLCERGWFGQKTGRGYYRYEGRRGLPDPEVLQIIDDERMRAGVTSRTFDNQEIMRRYLAAMINEGANVVQQRIALRPLDIDVTLIAGYGFPRHRGGPMKHADMIGLDRVLADIREFAKEDPLFWQPSPLLVELVERGVNFDSLNHLK